MNKRKARATAEAGTTSIGELRAMIQAARGRGGMSQVNPAFPLERVLDIYERAIAGRDAAEKPAGLARDPYSRVGRMKPTRDCLTVTNILRDCAP